MNALPYFSNDEENILPNAIHQLNTCGYLVTVAIVISTAILVDCISDMIFSLSDMKPFNVFRIQTVILLGLPNVVLFTDLFHTWKPEYILRFNFVKALCFICLCSSSHSLPAFSAALTSSLIFSRPFFNDILDLDDTSQLQLSVVLSLIFSISISFLLMNESSTKTSMTITTVVSGLFLSICLAISGTYHNVLYTLPSYEKSFSTPLELSFLIDVVLVFILVESIISKRLEKRELEEKLKSKEALIRLVAHETRTPLNIMIMGLKLVETNLDKLNIHDCELKDVLADTKAACGLAVQTLSEALMAEKISASAIILEKQEIDLLLLVQEAMSLFNLQAKHQGTVLRLVFGELMQAQLSQFVLLADKNKLLIVIRNLISNALKFTPTDGLVEIVVALAHTADCPMLQISVRDTGYGISKENLSKVFKEFVQFDASKQQNGGGTGLGLYTSHALMQLHGGSLRVHSDGEGKGCTFTMELFITKANVNSNSSVTCVAEPRVYQSVPADVLVDHDRYGECVATHCESCSHSSALTDSESEKDDDVVVALDSDATVSAPAGHTMKDFAASSLTALVVDDCALNRKMLIRTLVEKKFTNVTEATDGKVAIQLVANEIANHRTYDLIFMDLYMPNMDGPSAVRLIRERGYTGLIVGVTGDSSDDVVNKFETCGADTVLPKPFDMGKLDVLIQGIKSKTGN